jgi:bacterioferritin (cytochrome b1)
MTDKKINFYKQMSPEQKRILVKRLDTMLMLEANMIRKIDVLLVQPLKRNMKVVEDFRKSRITIDTYLKQEEKLVDYLKMQMNVIDSIKESAYAKRTDKEE